MGRVELLRHTHKRDALAVEQLHEPREVHQRPAQAIDFVDHHAVDLPGLDIGHQALQRRALDVAAGEAAVVVAVREADPPLGLLAGDERHATLALGVERVEVLVEPLLRGLAGVNGAADGLLRGGGGGGHAGSFVKPKNRKPFQREPVMAEATADSER